jgi:hypothetical protein
MSLAQGKKRYSLTFNGETLDALRSYMKEHNAPHTLLSDLFNDFLEDVWKTVQSLEAAQQRKGSEVGLGEIFSALGEILTDRDSEQLKLKGR